MMKKSVGWRLAYLMIFMLLASTTLVMAVHFVSKDAVKIVDRLRATAEVTVGFEVIRRMVAESEREILLALQQDPANRFSAFHTQRVSRRVALAKARISDIDAQWDKIKMGSLPEPLSLELNNVEEKYREVRFVMLQSLDHLALGNFEDANLLIVKKMTATLGEFMGLSDSFIIGMNQYLDNLNQEKEKNVSMINFISILGPALLLMTSTFFAWKTASSIIGSLNKFREVITKIYETRNPRIRIGDLGNDEIGIAAKAFDKLMDDLDAIVLQSNMRKAHSLINVRQLEENPAM